MGPCLPTTSPANASPSKRKPKTFWTSCSTASSAMRNAAARKTRRQDKETRRQGDKETRRRVPAPCRVRTEFLVSLEGEKPMKSFVKTEWLLALLLCCPAVGCGPAPAQPSSAPPAPEVLVSLPVSREVADYVDFPGRIEAVNSIEVRARVTGYLDKVYFQEGAEVKQGDLLFEIDPRPYKAELARTEGNIVQSEGRLRRMEAEHQRAT